MARLKRRKFAIEPGNRRAVSTVPDAFALLPINNGGFVGIANDVQATVSTRLPLTYKWVSPSLVKSATT